VPDVIIWIVVLIASILTIVWVSSRANGIGFFRYLKLYGIELMILTIVSIVMIVLMIGGSK